MEAKKTTYTFYLIRALDRSLDFSYIGSTSNLARRKSDHLRACYNKDNAKLYNLKLYRTIRDNGGMSAFEIVNLETQENITKVEALKRERQLFDELETNMNQNRPHRTTEERQDYNRDYFKTYYMDDVNRSQILQRMTAYYMFNREAKRLRSVSI